VHMDIGLKFTERVSKIIHLVTARAALILACFYANNPQVLVKCARCGTLSHDFVNAFGLSSFKCELDSVNLDLYTFY